MIEILGLMLFIALMGVSLVFWLRSIAEETCIEFLLAVLFT